jgi:tRNA threonylcarbamoyladenosine modification (KEOPS) complex Cgi121 subunit
LPQDKIEFVCVQLGIVQRPERLLKLLRDSSPGCVIQLLEDKVVSNSKLGLMIALQTHHAAARGTLLADKAEVDLMLRLSQTTQIAEALEKSGYKPGHKSLLIAIGPSRQMSKIKRKVRRTGTIVPSKDLTRDELAKVERSALLSASRF